MTVYSKIVKVKTKNIKQIENLIDPYLAKNPGIDYNVLQNTPAVEVVVIQFITSSKTPNLPHEHNMDDIDELIKESGIQAQVIAELQDHKNNPLNKANHLVRISDEQNKELERE
ncbi:MAG: hypothetical protein ABWY25_09280 [Paenisporosarcina sp.]